LNPPKAKKQPKEEKSSEVAKPEGVATQTAQQVVEEVKQVVKQ
jgi:hypothetical protein